MLKYILSALIVLGIIGSLLPDPDTNSDTPVKPLTAKEQRQKLIEKQFSPWDGSHRNLESLIKESMNDPSSYEHVKTTYWDQKTYLTVKTVFRGRNAFGGMVLDSVKANIDLNGNILKVLE